MGSFRVLKMRRESPGRAPVLAFKFGKGSHAVSATAPQAPIWNLKARIGMLGSAQDATSAGPIAEAQ